MLNSLLTGVTTALQPEQEDEHEEQGGVVLRREQVKMVLFQGKLGVVEDAKTGESVHLYTPQLINHHLQTTNTQH